MKRKPDAAEPPYAAEFDAFAERLGEPCGFARAEGVPTAPPHGRGQTLEIAQAGDGAAA